MEGKEVEKEVLENRFVKLCETYMKKYGEYEEQQGKIISLFNAKNKQNENMNHRVANQKKIEIEIRKLEEDKKKAIEEDKKIIDKKIDKQKNKIIRRNEELAASWSEWLIASSVSFVVAAVLYLFGLFHEAAYSAEFRWSLFWFGCSLFLGSGIAAYIFRKKIVVGLKKYIKRVETLEKNWKNLWTILVFFVWMFLGAIISFAWVGNNWTWGATTKLKDGSIQGKLIELSVFFTVFILLGIVIKATLVFVRKTCKINLISKKVLQKIQGDGAELNSLEMDRSEEKKVKEIEAENMFNIQIEGEKIKLSKEKEEENEISKQRENYLKLITNGEERKNVLKKELQEQWKALYEVADKLTEKPGLHEDLAGKIYLANFYEENAEEFQPMREINIHDKKPMVFLFDRQKKEGDEPEVLYDLVASVSMAFVCASGKVELHFVDYIMNGDALAKEFNEKNLAVTRWGNKEVDKLFHHMEGIKHDNSQIDLSEFNKTQIEDGNAEDGKQFQIINFVMLPSVYNGQNQEEQDLFGDKWNIFRGCGMRGILPIFYVDKMDWENPDNAFSSRLKEYYDGNVWYMKEQGTSFDIEPLEVQ